MASVFSSHATKAAGVAAAVAFMFFAGPATAENPAPYEGYKALVAEPERSFTYDSALFGALEERGFETTFGPIPADDEALSGYDLVALSTKRRLSDPETARLTKYVAGGGAVYGSWGGPMASRTFLREVCKVAGSHSVYIHGMDLLPSPLSRGIEASRIDFPDPVGNLHAGERGYEVVCFQPLPGAVPVAHDDQGNVLGVLSEYGQGRAAVLGLGPEQDKYYARRGVAPAMMDNLIGWLLEGKAVPRQGQWSNRLTVLLPAAARVTGVQLDGKAVEPIDTKQVGSVKRLTVDASGVAPETEAVLRVSYDPLPAKAPVETVAHLAWGTLSAAAESPAEAAEYLASLHVQCCIPLVRGSYGQRWYRGLPDDSRPDSKCVQLYQGDFLADFVAACHDRGITVVPDVYFDHSVPLRSYPDVRRLDRNGDVIHDQYGSELACFNDPRGQEHNLATISQLLGSYDVDGVILDDNFELDQSDCFCAFCRDGFRRYCEAAGVPWVDPTERWDGTTADLWRDYKRQATRDLIAKVAAIAREHNRPAGGWVSVGMNSMHMARSFDFLGGMVYTVPARAVWGPLSAMGDRKYICLLWALNRQPEDMARDAAEAVRGGCASVGFWMSGEDGGYRMDPGRSEAIRRSLGHAQEDWLDFYRNELVTGDPRFVVLSGNAGATELILRLRNTGARADRRFQGEVDLSGLK